MYHFIGYLVKNANGDPVNYSPSRPQAEQFCQQSNTSTIGITQVFEWKNQPVKEVVDIQPTEPESPTQHTEP